MKSVIVYYLFYNILKLKKVKRNENLTFTTIQLSACQQTLFINASLQFNLQTVLIIITYRSQ